MIDFEPWALALAFALGALAGAGYLALLWLAVSRLKDAPRPVLTLVSGMAVRLALLLAAFWLLTAGDPLRLVAALAGFLALRIIVTRVIGRPAPGPEPVRG
jgi:F1F0 ATPase subunit 2